MARLGGRAASRPRQAALNQRAAPPGKRSNAARRRDLNGSQTISADVTDASLEGRRKLDSPGQTEPLHRPTLLAPVAAWRDDAPNILPLPPALAALPAEPPPDLDRVAIVRAALDALDLDQRAKLFLQYPVEVIRAYVRLTRSAA